MIQIEGLSKVYGSRARTVTALRNVTLAIEPGVWGVVGPNGAGKTTLLGLILGFLRPSDGSVTIDGIAPRRYLRRHGAAYLPERFGLPAAWSVRAALRGLARLDGHRGADAGGRVDAVLDRTGLADHAHRTVGDLSRGLNQRVGLAQALLGDRRLVVLDEPTEGLDPLWRVRFRDLVTDLRNRDRIVLLASHDLAEVERLADRVIVLDDGTVSEVMAARQPPGGPLRFRLLVDASAERVRTAFPGAAVERGPDHAEHGAQHGPGADHSPGAEPGPHVGAAYLVEVADPAELSHRLAALLDAGAVVRGVVPMAADLETRVRHRLEER